MNLIEDISNMSNSPVKNYVIPGLTSSLIGSPHRNGLVRLFECSRDHYESINPHSHRFGFHCLVLAGNVKNIIWNEYKGHEDKDLYQRTRVFYTGIFGKYELVVDGISAYAKEEKTYYSGQWYSMDHTQIHSIFFSKACKVLFFEKAPVNDYSIVLEPVVDGKVIPTFKVEDWMFQRDPS